MNELQIFTNPEFGEIRTIEEDGKVLFCGKDVAEALGYKDSTNAIKQHCRGVVKRHLTDSLGRKQEANFIPEGDIYRLAAKSELPGADRFESWIFDEVLPSIRKTGGYVNDDELFIRTYLPYADEQSKDMFRATLGTIRNLNARIEQDKPKVLFADAVATAHTSILVGELAKLLKQNGVDIGQNRLFQKLREDGYLIRRQGNDYNMPTQRSMEMGLFEIKETVIAHADGHTSINKTPKVTGRGHGSTRRRSRILPMFGTFRASPNKPDRVLLIQRTMVCQPADFMFAINSNHPVAVPCDHDADWMMHKFAESSITTGKGSQEITSFRRYSITGRGRPQEKKTTNGEKKPAPDGAVCERGQVRWRR